MINFLKKLFGFPESTALEQPQSNPTKRSDQTRSVANQVLVFGEPRKTEYDARPTKEYFATMAALKKAVSDRDHERAARLTRQNLKQIPGFVRAIVEEYDSFGIQSIPGLEVGGTMLALVGDDEGLAEMRSLVTTIPELERWADAIEEHGFDRRLVPAILRAIEDNLGCRQSEMKALLGIEDGHRMANLISWLEKFGKIKRKKSTRRTRCGWQAHRRHPPRRRLAWCAHAERVGIGHRYARSISKKFPTFPCRELLMRGKENAHGRRKTKSRTWRSDLRSGALPTGRSYELKKIPAGGKPDPAFRRFYAIDSGLFMIDDLGNAVGLGEIPAAAIRYSRSGEEVVKKALAHDIYRLEIRPMDRGMIAMSENCVVHAYNDDLELIVETSLKDAPEIQALRKRLGIEEGKELKNYIRCVALSRDRSRYLFTAVDEAWCIGMDARGIWGVKLPIQEGWERVIESGSTFGTSEEIDQALALMGLSYPFTPEDVKVRYRELAKQWHPDLNAGDPQATARMQALNAAAQLLTGIAGQAIGKFTGVQYQKEFGRTEMEIAGQRVTLTFSRVVDEKHAADWIYAASFSGTSNRVFLASYTGRVIVVDEKEAPIRAYNIGAVPKQIIDTGDYLYIQTTTRLYILKENALHAIIDTFDAGDLIVSQTGFGLLKKRRFRWFTEHGLLLGTVITKDPIRRVYHGPKGLVVETRTHRGIVRGAPTWWGN